jgi:hypothetical protein
MGSDNGIVVYGTSANDYGVWGTTSGGIGVYGATTGSGYAGFFLGSVLIDGALSVSSCSGCTSDIRLKKNVKPLTRAMDKLLQLKGVTYEWKDPAEHENHTGTQTGFIAQDVEKVFPEWVKDDGYTAPDHQKYKTLETRQIEALEVESIRELKSEVDDLKAEVRDLKANRRPLISGLTAEGGLFGIGFVTVAGAFVVSRRKRSQSGAQG